jgi:23S rRNA (uridine2552-2'-O)-methyltransferase
LSRWIRERKNDHYHKRAKDHGYRSRAAYKLIQIDERFNIFEDARYVLDLGAAPGGWLQVASFHIDEKEGLIVGVDLEEIAPFFSNNVVTIMGDITDPLVNQQIIELFDNKVDIVLSDMAPEVIGQWDVDQYRQVYLARNALLLAHKLLKDDGWFITKIFQGGEHIKFIKEVKEIFEYVKNFKPKASRKGSSERYIVARNLKKDRKPPKLVLRDSIEEEEEGPLPGDQLFQDPGNK